MATEHYTHNSNCDIYFFLLPKPKPPRRDTELAAHAPQVRWSVFLSDTLSSKDGY